MSTLDYNLSNLESAPDEVLIALIQAGQLGTEALTVLYERYHLAIWRFAESRQRGSGDDIMMGTMVIMIEKLQSGTFHWSGAPIASWLIGVAKVLLKKRVQNPCFPLDEALFKSSDQQHVESESTDDVAENEAHLDDYLRNAKLSVYERQLVYEKLRGRKWADIAEDLGRTHGAVRVAYNKALKKLRAHYGKTE